MAIVAVVVDVGAQICLHSTPLPTLSCCRCRCHPTNPVYPSQQALIVREPLSHTRNEPSWPKRYSANLCLRVGQAKVQTLGGFAGSPTDNSKRRRCTNLRPPCKQPRSVARRSQRTANWYAPAPPRLVHIHQATKASCARLALVCRHRGGAVAVAQLQAQPTM